MKIRFFAAAAWAASSMMAVAAHAADTPGSNPSVKTPSVGERMAAARKAIDAKDWNKAMSELNIAVREEPRNADVHNLLGYSYRKRATPDLAKAFEHYGTALKLDPRHKGAHEYIGEAYLMDKKPAEAEKHLVQLEAICGNKTCEEYEDLAKSIAQYKAKN
ncbi:M48 family metallopeptidase [Caenimonas sp. SL110]|uniref:tetratricopeptide repeat protein n=1 Tax=Caenimonas sp. SL110 TaxID=1450524 RepID=UPI000652E4EB|nr:tetratricopeptide repeat protein [Caenimonas sp. SL110]